MSVSTVLLVSSAIGSSLAALASALAAWRSAEIAKRAYAHQQSVTRQSLIRTAWATASRIVAEGRLVTEMAQDLGREYDSLGIFAGRGPNFRNPRREEVEGLMGEIPSRVKKAEETLADEQSLQRLSDEDLAETLAQFETDQIDVERIKECLNRDLHSVRDQNAQYRAAQMNRRP